MGTLGTPTRAPFTRRVAPESTFGFDPGFVFLFLLWLPRSIPCFSRSSERAMPQKLYVGNLSFAATEDEIRDLFSQYGEVHSVSLISDRETGRPRGFAFVEMENAQQAIDGLDNQEFGGRNLKVNLAREREGGGGGGGRGGYGGGRSGGGGGGGGGYGGGGGGRGGGGRGGGGGGGRW
jgi:hypothetical protein